MNPSEEIIDIVNEENEVIGQSSRGEAHKKGYIHRALSVLVLNSKGQILLQQRSEKTQIHPLSWDLSTSENLLAGENYEIAGKRSLKEELGVEVEVKIITKTTLQRRKYKLEKQIHYDNEIVLMLIATHDGPFNIDPTEVYNVNFFSIEEIEQMVKNKVKFTPWFLDEWENVKKVLRDKY